MKEDAWLKHVMKLLDSDGERQMSWSELSLTELTSFYYSLLDILYKLY